MNEKKKKVMSPFATAEMAREAFGRPMRQPFILDEGDHEIDPKDELWTLSKGCKVSLVFAHSPKADLKAVTDTTQSIAHKTTSAVSDAWRSNGGDKSSTSPSISTDKPSTRN